MKIGLYGGAFDPIHNAHMIIAQFIKEELSLEKIIFIPSALPPHKSVFAAAERRLLMVQAAIASNPVFEYSEIEIEKGGTIYSVDTIAQLKEIHRLPRSCLFWIMGSDNFADFSKWKDPDLILELCHVVVFPRSTIDFHRSPVEYRKKVIYVSNAPLIDISSTLVRSLISAGRSISYLVPPAVEEVIKSSNLYR
ncbi:MAG: nicotinate-nucleotide adenylyltransferase [Calditrichaeota bacterium]|nr:nicotinate-nucleotide adenylyltransferase [Calditrichota bacterium]